MLTWFIHFHTLGADGAEETEITLSDSPQRTVTITGEDRTASILRENRVVTTRPENRKVPVI